MTGPPSREPDPDPEDKGEAPRTAPVSRVHIRYLRPPDRTEVFTQLLLVDRDDVKITLARDMELDTAMRINERVALETGSDVVWFTFPGRWHDIGRFHRSDGSFTGLYANILTPPVFLPDGIWETTDLFLDLWIPPEGTARVLDRPQLDDAEARGWVTPETAARAREEARGLVRKCREGSWPPEIVEEWTLDRARRSISEREGNIIDREGSISDLEGQHQ